MKPKPQIFLAWATYSVIPSAHTSVSISMSSKVEDRVTYEAHDISYQDSAGQIGAGAGFRQDEPPGRNVL